MAYLLAAAEILPKAERGLPRRRYVMAGQCSLALLYSQDKIGDRQLKSRPQIQDRQPFQRLIGLSHENLYK